jgi:hypothetical protein
MVAYKKNKNMPILCSRDLAPSSKFSGCTEQGIKLSLAQINSAKLDSITEG